MAKNAILMSIRPEYAEKIFGKTKTVELRRVKPKTLASGDLIFVYVSSPVQALVGAFKVASVLEKPLLSLWTNVRDYAGISRGEFLDYYEGVEKGVAIFIEDVWRLPKPIHLSELRRGMKGFYPPQSFRYTSIQQLEKLQ